MKILHISYHTSPLAHLGLNDGGGLSTYVHELCNVLSLSNSLIVITSENSKNKKNNLYEINTYSPLSSEVGMQEKIENLESFIHEFINSYTKERIKEFDIMHAHYWLSGMIAKKINNKFGIPFVYTSHSLGLFNQSQSSSKYRINKEKEIMEAAKMVTASSNFEFNFINNNYSIPKSKIIKILPGVNRDIFFPNEFKETREVKRIFCVGRIQEQKGQYLVLNFMKLLSELQINFHIYFVGEPSGEMGIQYLNKIKEGINENKLLDRTTFLGSLSQESLAEELRNADLLVHTSKFETFGLVIVEANACGLPVLALNDGPMEELVSNNVNVFISDHFTNDQLKIFVNNIFYDKKESIEIKKSSFKKSKEYSWEKTGKKFSELYNALI